MAGAPPPQPHANPLVGASLLSSATLHFGLSFVGRIFRRGAAVTPADFWALPPFEQSRSLLALVSAAWAAERQARAAAPSIFRAFWAVFGIRYVLHSAVLLVKSAFFFGMTVLLQGLLEGLQEGLPAQDLYLYALGFVLCACVQASLHHSFFWLAWRAGQQWRTAALGLIFQKTLRLRLDALGAVSVGGLVSLASNDLERTTKLCQMLAYTAVGPIEAAVALALLWRVVGVAALAGYACMALLVLWSGQAGKLFGALRERTARLSDARLHLTAQVVAGARVIKAFGWEAAFAREVRGVRREELAALWTTAALRAVNEGIFNVAPVLMGAATFLTAHFGAGRVLRPSDVFVALTLLQFLQAEMCAFWPRAIESIAETSVLLQRLQRLLELDEAPPLVLEAGEGSAGSGGGADARVVLSVASLTTAWPAPAQSPFAAKAKPQQPQKQPQAQPAAAPAKGQPLGLPAGEASSGSAAGQVVLRVAEAPSALPAPAPAPAPLPALQGVTFSVRAGQLCGVCGPVGSGKSTLLLRLLQEVGGETNGSSSSSSASSPAAVRLSGTVAYASQSAWVETGSVWDTFLLGGAGRGEGQGPDEARYAAVLHACCLEEDCAAWPEGDRTVVGEKGVTLSGGQKARINLARALYKGADLYLLDDPLSVRALLACGAARSASPRSSSLDHNFFAQRTPP